MVFEDKKGNKKTNISQKNATINLLGNLELTRDRTNANITLGLRVYIPLKYMS